MIEQVGKKDDPVRVNGVRLTPIGHQTEIFKANIHRHLNFSSDISTHVIRLFGFCRDKNSKIFFHSTRFIQIQLRLFYLKERERERERAQNNNKISKSFAMNLQAKFLYQHGNKTRNSVAMTTELWARSLVAIRGCA